MFYNCFILTPTWGNSFTTVYNINYHLVLILEVRWWCLMVELPLDNTAWPSCESRFQLGKRCLTCHLNIKYIIYHMYKHIMNIHRMFWYHFKRSFFWAIRFWSIASHSSGRKTSPYWRTGNCHGVPRKPRVSWVPWSLQRVNDKIGKCGMDIGESGKNSTNMFSPSHRTVGLVYCVYPPRLIPYRMRKQFPYRMIKPLVIL